ncbi:unnamed protein product [Closterium sp. NIES-64]|nr:unnamed protein product [Closterium sp. NIES-64]
MQTPGTVFGTLCCSRLVYYLPSMLPPALAIHLRLLFHTPQEVAVGRAESSGSTPAEAEGGRAEGGGGAAAVRRVERITGPDFVREVTEASQSVWVVVHLFRDSIISNCLSELARSHPQTKFVRIVSTECIPNYPDAHLPTLLVYHKGALKATLAGMHQFGGKNCTTQDVAFALCKVGPVLASEDEDEEAVMERVQKDYVKNIVKRHVEKGDDEDDD